MVSIAKNVDLREIQKRAAHIRSHWSPAEKLRRTGLPPDVPTRLREFITGSRQHGWSTSTAGGNSRG
jgi:hypothetical protein